MPALDKRRYVCGRPQNDARYVLYAGISSHLITFRLWKTPHAKSTFFGVLPLPTPTTVSAREIDVLREVVRGATNSEIAATLFVSSRTVQTHVRNLMQKTDTRNRTHLAVKGIRLGLVALPPLAALE